MSIRRELPLRWHSAFFSEKEGGYLGKRRDTGEVSGRAVSQHVK